MARSGAKGDDAAAIKSAFTKFGQFASVGKNSRAKSYFLRAVRFGDDDDVLVDRRGVHDFLLTHNYFDAGFNSLFFQIRLF